MVRKMKTKIIFGIVIVLALLGTVFIATAAHSAGLNLLCTGCNCNGDHEQNDSSGAISPDTGPKPPLDDVWNWVITPTGPKPPLDGWDWVITTTTGPKPPLDDWDWVITTDTGPKIPDDSWNW